ncbi:MAG: transporter substrate-binding domain-containing protein [Desulfobacteraceae bacterium]|nr:transporter substrate-binding domain-containing protein [Desulfobacteraceae bacterium]
MYCRIKYLFCNILIFMVFFLFFLPIIHADTPGIQSRYSSQFSQEEYTGNDRFYTATEQAFIDTHPKIKVSNEFDWPPFDFIADDKPAGFSIDLMNLLARKSGLSISYVNGYTWDELMKMFFDGRLDVIHSVAITPERQKKALFSSTFYHGKYVLVFKSDTQDIQNLNDLDKKIIALPKGWATIEFFKTYYPEVHIIEVESSAQAFEYVDLGKVTATVEREGLARYLINELGFTDLKFSRSLKNEILQKASSLRFAVLKTNPILFSILNKTLAGVTPSEMEALKQKWLSKSGWKVSQEYVGLTLDEQNWLKEKHQIRVCVSPERLPFSAIRGNQIIGMTADFLEMFSKKLKVPFKLIPSLSFADAVRKVETGAGDILPMISKTGKRKEQLDFTSAFMDYNVVVIAREDFPFISDISRLGSKRIGMVAGSNLLGKVIQKYPKLNYIPMETIEQCLIDVSTGQLDAVILSLPVASHYIQEVGLTNLKVVGHTGIKEELRIGVQKGNKLLYSIMGKLVRSLNRQELEKIYQKWIGNELKRRPDYTLLWQAMSIFGIILMIVVLWNRNLSRLNKQIAIAHEKLTKKTDELEYISITDGLTGIFNRCYIEGAFELELKRSIRHGRDLSIIILDIDYFKAVNDTYGHQVGDEVLKKLSNLVKNHIRVTDIFGRWGGEEFLLVCPEINIYNASGMARSLCRRIEAKGFGKAGVQTASFGVTSFKKGDNSRIMILRADEALYLAKDNGRNRVESIS